MILRERQNIGDTEAAPKHVIIQGYCVCVPDTCMSTVSIAQTETPQDTLLESLVLLTHIHHKPISADALKAGLPLVEGRLTPELFVRAAEKAGFKATIVTRKIDQIIKPVLPVVLLRRHGTACVLLDFVDEDKAQVVYPDNVSSTVTVDLKELERDYSGKAIYCKIAYRFTDTFNLSSDDGHWFWSVIKKSRGIYAEVLVASLLINLFALVSPLFIMNVYDRVVPNYAIETLWVLSSGVMVVLAFDIIMKGLRGYFIDVAGKRADILLSSSTFSRVLDIQMKFRPASVGSFANNLQEFDSFREFFTSTTLIAIIDLPFTLLFIFLIYSIGGVLAWVPLLAIPIIIGAGLIIQKPLHRLITTSFTESARKHAMLVEALTALDTIKGVRAEGTMQRRWEEFNARIAKLGLRTRFLSLCVVNFAQLVQHAGTVAVVIVGVYQIAAGELSIGGLIACTILTGRSLAPMAQVATILTRYHHSVAAFTAVNNIMALPVERPEGHKFLHRGDIRGAYEFRNVNFAYPDQKNAALKDVTFSIKAGERVGFVGRMGSGKTTIQKLMLNFYQPSDGSILVDGTDINQLDPSDLRGQIGYVPQDIILFAGSVRDNIVIGNPQADDASVVRASKISGLGEFIDQHSDGYDLMVGERGDSLSGGQRQAIAISRAILSNPNILLLDEPTNAMDNTTEINFKDKIVELLEGKTLILVTHKTSMLSLVDRLIVMNDGRVVADGPKDEVLKALSGG